MKIKILTSRELFVPPRTSIITNAEFITLSRNKPKNNGIILLFTCCKEDIDSYDLMDEAIWTEYTLKELKKIIELHS